MRSDRTLTERLMWDFGESVEPELVEQFEEAIQIVGISRLNPLERYRFGRWLTQGGGTDALRQFFSAFYPNLLPIRFPLCARPSQDSFPRSESLLLRNTNKFLGSCGDNHPYVKIEMLEDAILPNWRFQSTEVQESWLVMVVDMLSDSFVRRHAATGLIDMSGTHYDYHAEHTHEQKKQWFVAIAPKVEWTYQFDHWESFDRFLTKLDDYFLELPVPYRTQLLQSVAGYVNKSLGVLGGYPIHNRAVGIQR